MTVKFCVNGDYQVAIKAARSADHCRDCYVAEVLDKADDLLVAEVVGAAPVTDARTQESVAPGGEVVLDPAATNVAALVAAGAVKVSGPRKKATPAKPADKAKG